MKRSARQKTAPCTWTSFTMKPVPSYLTAEMAHNAAEHVMGLSDEALAAYPSILTSPASATIKSYSSALVANGAHPIFRVLP